MEDEKIIELFWNRDSQAITETTSKYERLCRYVAGNILVSREDIEEVLNDTYLALWNTIPPEHPNLLPAFISRITRNLALKRFDYNSAAKRNPEAVQSLEELEDCVCGDDSVDDALENRRIEGLISSFLWKQSEERRIIFIRRYWYFDSIKEISKLTGYSESKIKSMLFHVRNALRLYLEKEGVDA